MCSKVKLGILFVLLIAGSFESATGAKRSWWRSVWSIFKPVTCTHNGKEYKKGDTFGRSYDPETNTCYYHQCVSNKNVIKLSIPNCKVITSPPTQTTTTTTRPTTQPPTTGPTGCIENGVHYVPGQQISSGRIGNWCFGRICGEEGHMIAWDNFRCGVSSTTPTVAPSTPPGK